MGCFNYSCFLTHHAVRYGDEVATLIVNESYGGFGTRQFFEPAPFFFYGKYDDYGGVEDCHGSQLSRIQRVIKEHVVPVEPEAGYQEEIGVNKNEISMKTLFRASTQDDLRFSTPATFKAALGGDVDPHTKVAHITILKSALDKFLETYTYSTVVTDEEGQYAGREDVSYQDVINGIPELIEALREHYGSEDTISYFGEPLPERDKLSKKAQHIAMLLRTEFSETSFFWNRPVKKAIEDAFLSDRKDFNNFDDLTEMLTEFAKVAFVELYARYSRTAYIPYNSGSQDTDWDAIVLMADITKSIAAERQEEFEAETLPDDAWDEARQLYIEQCELAL